MSAVIFHPPWGPEITGTSPLPFIKNNYLDYKRKAIEKTLEVVGRRILSRKWKRSELWWFNDVKTVILGLICSVRFVYPLWCLSQLLTWVKQLLKSCNCSLENERLYTKLMVKKQKKTKQKKTNKQTKR